jgi:hypothetical protein
MLPAAESTAHHRHHLGRSDVEVGPDAECRVIDSEAFAEIIDADEGIPAAHGNLHSSSKNINVALLF